MGLARALAAFAASFAAVLVGIYAVVWHVDFRCPGLTFGLLYQRLPVGGYALLWPLVAIAVSASLESKTPPSDVVLRLGALHVVTVSVMATLGFLFFPTQAAVLAGIRCEFYDDNYFVLIGLPFFFGMLACWYACVLADAMWARQQEKKERQRIK